MAVKEAERIQATYAEAMRLMKSGAGEAALHKFAEVLKANPRIAEAHFQVARLFLGVDRLDRALHHAKQAAQLRPNVVDIWRLLSEIILTLSDVDERDLFRKALAKSGLSSGDKTRLKTSVDLNGRSRPPADIPKTVFDSFASALQQGDYSLAETTLLGVISRYPKSAVARDALSVALYGQKRHGEALAASDEALRLQSNFPEARLNRARILSALGRAPEGLHQCNLSLRSVPGHVPALLARAECYRALNKAPEVQADLQRALKLEPKNERTAMLLASVLIENFDYFTAEDLIAKTWKDPKKRPLPVATQQARIFIETNRPEEGRQAYLEIADAFANDANAMLQLAELNQTLGDFEAAQGYFDAAMEQHPDRGEVYRVYLTSKKVALDDPIVAHMQSKFDDPSVDPKSRAQFGFALAKVHEDQKAYDKVFDYLHPANAYIRESERYSIDNRLSLNGRILDAMKKVDWSDPPMRTENTQAPIFVTGMPRSGTTLVEQIIASHSRVEGAGEVSRITQLALSAMGGEDMPLVPPHLLPPQTLDDLATEFGNHLSRLCPWAEVITDKSIQSYMFVGLAKMAMPQSRFVIIKRDPRDNLLSMYKNVFPNRSHMYSYKLSWLAQMYQNFEEFLAFWRDVRPDWIYEIQYEDLVANPEEETRKLIDACGLEWEDACLRFHENERRVNTLSLYQVRQPMYKSSTNAWERYGDALDELFEALGPEYARAAE